MPSPWGRSLRAAAAGPGATPPAGPAPGAVARAIAGGFALALAAVPASAQATRSEMVVECVGSVPDLVPLCVEGVLALEAARGGLGIAASQGSPVPGSSSTLGRRLGLSPRLAFSTRASLARVGMPDPRSGEAPAEKRSFLVPAAEASLTVGVLDGVSLLPTVGGILSVDLIGTVGTARLGEADGFAGPVQWLGYGVRMGLLRESFTLPGLSVAAVQRRLTETEWSRESQPAHAVFQATGTSVRVTAGKEFLAFGVLGGWGWERYEGTSTVGVAPPGVAVAGQAQSSDFTSERSLFFGGLSFTFLVLQFAAEGGLATGWDAVPDRERGGYDPTAGTIFGALAARLTF